MSSPSSRPLLVVDGDSLAHRAYHALPKTFRRAEGKAGNALLGFSNFILRLWQAEPPRAGLVGGGSLGFAAAKAPGYEADDFLAAAVEKEEKRGGNALVVTSDRDSFQLASGQTTILTPTRGVSELARIGPAEVRERYGVEPEQVPDFIALRGDPSDRMPGAKGVGPKKAADVLKQHGSLAQALADGRFPQVADELLLYQSIATMDVEAPLPEL